MSLFTQLFRLRKKHIDLSFSQAKHHASIRGIKILHAPALPDTPHASFLIVPTRRCKGIAARNKLRRRIKSIIYEEQLYQQDGTFLILLYEQAKALSFDELKSFFVKELR